MPKKKSVPTNRDRLVALITILEADLPKLEMDESFQRHTPEYYNCVIYYEDLVETLLELGGKDQVNLFGAYLVGLLAYQVMERQVSLYDAVKMILEELKIKVAEIDQLEKNLDNKDDSDDGPKYYDA